MFNDMLPATHVDNTAVGDRVTVVRDISDGLLQDHTGTVVGHHDGTVLVNLDTITDGSVPFLPDELAPEPADSTDRA